MGAPPRLGSTKHLGGSAAPSEEELEAAVMALVRVAAAVLRASGELQVIDEEWVDFHLRLSPVHGRRHG